MWLGNIVRHPISFLKTKHMAVVVTLLGYVVAQAKILAKLVQALGK